MAFILQCPRKLLLSVTYLERKNSSTHGRHGPGSIKPKVTVSFLLSRSLKYICFQTCVCFTSVLSASLMSLELPRMLYAILPDFVWTGSKMMNNKHTSICFSSFFLCPCSLLFPVYAQTTENPLRSYFRLNYGLVFILFSILTSPAI